MGILFRFVRAVQAKQRPSQREIARAKAWGKFQCLSYDWLSFSEFLLMTKKHAQTEMRPCVTATTGVDGLLKRLFSLFLMP